MRSYASVLFFLTLLIAVIILFCRFLLHASLTRWRILYNQRLRFGLAVVKLRNKRSMRNKRRMFTWWRFQSRRARNHRIVLAIATVFRYRSVQARVFGRWRQWVWDCQSRASASRSLALRRRRAGILTALQRWRAWTSSRMVAVEQQTAAEEYRRRRILMVCKVFWP